MSWVASRITLARNPQTMPIPNIIHAPRMISTLPPTAQPLEYAEIFPGIGFLSTNSFCLHRNPESSLPVMSRSTCIHIPAWEIRTYLDRDSLSSKEHVLSCTLRPATIVHSLSTSCSTSCGLTSASLAAGSFFFPNSVWHAAKRIPARQSDTILQ